MIYSCAITEVLNVAMWHCGNVAASMPCPKTMKSNLRGPKITDSSIVNYDSFKFVKFVLKIAPNRGVKFGSAQKMLYLCIVNRWSSESHESSLSNGRVATEMDEVNQKTGAHSK